MTRLTVAISGARGFVGSRLLRVLADADVQRVGLSRTPRTPAASDGVEWRACDLFSLEDAMQALRGVDVAFYLVHAMSPHGRLTRGAFEDLDLICADHFARAAALCGVRQIIYLAGLVPEGSKLSRHLTSRCEIERVLSAHGVPVTVLRAGLVVGSEGASFRMLFRLVRRLPVMISPRWMRMRTQPIDLDDIVQLLAYCIDREETLNRTFDVGGPDVMSYEDMIRVTAEVLGRSPRLIPFPYFTTGLSCLWVSLVTGAPRSLVRPLVDSLNHETVARDRSLQERAGIFGQPFSRGVRAALGTPDEKRPRAFTRGAPEATRVAHSVERHVLPAGWDADRVAREYMTWLVHFLPFLQARRHGEDRVSIHVAGLPWPLLTFAYDAEASSCQRSVFRVLSGALSHPKGRGRLEFVLVPGRSEVISAVHDFRPRLWWWLYKLSQMPIHALVMWAFGRHLARLARGLSMTQATS